MNIYFDNSATTKCIQPVCDAVIEAMQNTYGNPSSAHRIGMDAEMKVRTAREGIARTLHCSPKEIFFTSGGTESDNWALIGGALANRRAGTHLITTAIEHPAVLQPMQFLEKQGFQVTYLHVDSYGRIDLHDLENALRDDTILVSIMTVNNEIGTVQPISEASSLVKKFRPQILFHTDAVQAYGKLNLRPQQMGIDLMSVSGHKIHGPKGIGFLYVKEHSKILPYQMGGGQQGGMRSGTDNVPGIAGLAAAAAECCGNLNENEKYLRALKTSLIAGLSGIDDVVIHTPFEDPEDSAPHIVNASFIGIRSEVLLHALEEEGIYVSAGSACSTNKKLPVSPVLEQLNLPRAEAESALRFSFSTMNTEEEVGQCIQVLLKLVPMLRRYSRR